MEKAKGRDRRKYGVVGLCFGALAMSSVIRISLGVAAPTLMKEYDISPAAMGYVLSGWNWSYTACQLIIGPVVDRFRIVDRFGSGSRRVEPFHHRFAPGYHSPFSFSVSGRLWNGAQHVDSGSGLDHLQFVSLGSEFQRSGVCCLLSVVCGQRSAVCGLRLTLANRVFSV